MLAVTSPIVTTSLPVPLCCASFTLIVTVLDVAVTPLSVMNDEENAVEVILDEELKNESKVGVHPCVNTATVLLSMNDVEKYISSCGNKIKYIKI